MLGRYRRGFLLGVVRVDDGSLCDGQHGADMCQKMVTQYRKNSNRYVGYVIGIASSGRVRYFFCLFMTLGRPEQRYFCCVFSSFFE